MQINYEFYEYFSGLFKAVERDTISYIFARQSNASFSLLSMFSFSNMFTPFSRFLLKRLRVYITLLEMHLKKCIHILMITIDQKWKIIRNFKKTDFLSKKSKTEKIFFTK